MEKSSAIHIAELLEGSSGLGYTIGTDLFVARTSDNPTNCISIYDTTGKAPDDLLDNSKNYECPGIQIIVRNSNYENGIEEAYTIANFLHNKIDFEADNTAYLLIKLATSPLHLKYDKHRRALFTMNFDIIRVEN